MNYEGLLTTGEDEGPSVRAKLERWLANPDRYDIGEILPRQTWAEVVAEVGETPVTERVKWKAGRMVKVPAVPIAAPAPQVAETEHEDVSQGGEQLMFWEGAEEARKAIDEFNDIAKGLGAA